MKKAKKNPEKVKSIASCIGVGGLCGDVYASLLNSRSLNGREHFTFIRRPAGSSQINYIDFACNGRYLACIELKCNPDQRDPMSWNNLLPISQLLLLQLADHSPEHSQQRNNLAFPSEDINDFEIAASIELDFIDVYCVNLSNDTTQIAVYGFSYKEIPRKPTIYVYEFVHVKNSISIQFKSKFTFDACEILSAKVTSSTFLPTNDNILVTSICTDYHSVRKTNYLDFWNTQTSLHFAKLSILKECPRFQGYISSKSFSPDSLILALISSTKDWQLLLFSVAANKFGKLFSLQEHGYDDPVDHFTTFCEFGSTVGKYELVVLSATGNLTKLAINPENLTIQQIVYSIEINDEPHSNISAFKYCPALSRYYFKTKTKLSFTDIQSGATNTEYAGNGHDNLTAKTCSSIAISKTGKQIAMTTNSHTVKVFPCKFQDKSLKNLCRCYIIKNVPEHKILKLDLPKVLHTYLLFGKY